MYFPCKYKRSKESCGTRRHSCFASNYATSNLTPVKRSKYTGKRYPERRSLDMFAGLLQKQSYNNNRNNKSNNDVEKERVKRQKKISGHASEREWRHYLEAWPFIFKINACQAEVTTKILSM